MGKQCEENPFKFPFVLIQDQKTPRPWSGETSNLATTIVGSHKTEGEADKQARQYAAANPGYIYTVVQITNVFKREEPPVTKIEF